MIGKNYILLVLSVTFTLGVYGITHSVFDSAILLLVFMIIILILKKLEKEEKKDD